MVNPRIQISTPTIFNSFDGGFSSSISHSDDEDLFGIVRFSNDLQKPAEVLVPEIQQAIESLMGEKGCKLARMSGSGATCFGLFDKKDIKAVWNSLADETNSIDVLARGNVGVLWR